MKKMLFFAGLLCVGSIANIEAAAPSEDFKTSVEVSQGYRRDDLNIKLGHSDRHKLHFKHVNVYTTRLDVILEKDDYFLKALAGYGDVCSGKLHRGRDHHHGHGHHNDHHRNVNGDYTADFAVTFGKAMRMSDGWSISPTVGYGVYLQDFHTKHHHHHHHNHHSRESVFAAWYSPQFGLSVQKDFSDTMNAYVSYMCLYPLNYQGKIRHGHHGSHHNRNTQENKAYESVGNIGTVGFEWIFCDNWSLKPEIELMGFYSKGGDSDHRYKFKHARRTAVEYRLVLGYMF